MKHVVVDDNFSHITEEMEAGVKLAVQLAGDVVVQVAREEALRSGYKLEPVVSTIKRTTAQRGDHSWFVLVFAPDFRTRFFEKGTYRKLGAGPGGGGNRGVKPVHMLAHARKAATPVLFEQIRRVLS